ncbi:TRM11 family methyltransferase [Enterococcus thailandicus]|uniref:modification methylase n=1 Tax=Enterococcus thailandicus TaxID=417368 RepID=UPI003984FD10
MNLATQIEEKQIGYWDFTGRQERGIHNICVYPATMVPNMQKELIRMILQENPKISNILDPFHGSGVTLVEGVNSELAPIGIDINPLANLITRVKLQGIDKKKIKKSISDIEDRLASNSFQYEKHSFQNIEKWYRGDFIDTFSKIRAAIIEEKSANIRKYFWVCLIDPLKKYSNTRSSTFKLHVKEEEVISSMKDNICADFLAKIKKNYELLPTFNRKRKIKLYIDDSSKILKNMKEESIDFICTSPPYGDNSTTVTYGQFSMLPIYWINRKDLGSFDDSLIQNYSSIDTSSLGGRKKKNREDISSKIFHDYLGTISENKRYKVVSFVLDYFEVLKNFNHVLKKDGVVMMTIGNRRVDNKILPLTELTKEFFKSLGYSVEAEMTRNIPTKRMPRKVSKVGEVAVESMNIEYVLIFQKH